MITLGLDLHNPANSNSCWLSLQEVLYSGKPSREKTVTNFLVWESPAKVLSTKFEHAPPTYTIDLAFHESFLCEMLTSTDPWKFSPLNVSRYNFLWIKILPIPATFVLQEICVEEFFANTVKVAISSMQSLIQDKKISMIKNFANENRWVKLANFCPGEYSAYTIFVACNMPCRGFCTTVLHCLQSYAKPYPCLN